MRTTFFAQSLLALLFLGACNFDGVTAPGGDTLRPQLGPALPASQQDQWRWFDVDGTTCNDGTRTGVGVSRGASSNVLLFLNGGGACWDYLTCFQLRTASSGPYGQAQFYAMIGNVSGSIFDRTQDRNPFKDWNLVFIPYCTGDVHAGDNDVTYTADGQPSRTWRHRGRSNMVTFLRRIAATFPNPPKVVLSGSSAGGFGASFNYDLTRRYWPSGSMYVVDDAGPPFIGDAVPADRRDAWFTNWRLDNVLDPLCPTCRNDFSSYLPVLANKYPHDRVALLSFTQDQVIRLFFNQDGNTFQANLYDLGTRVLDPLPSYRYYYLAGDTHTLLPTASTRTSADGVTLFDWLAQMVGDDPTWISHKP
ncbi:MAG TPA: pectin acetylesterase-family hydrolase [Polyangia bacterium]|nr:pectin acetylesterase-family hydrolase [Polyangia bacterium]